MIDMPLNAKVANLTCKVSGDWLWPYDAISADRQKSGNHFATKKILENRDGSVVGRVCRF